MSLQRLCSWHFFSVQTNENAVKDSSGARNIRDSWETVYENLAGHIQITPSSTSRGRDDRVFVFDKPELETYYQIFHRNLELNVGPQHNIITALSWDEPIDWTDESLTENDVRIYQVVSPRQEVVPVPIWKNFRHIYMKEIPRRKL